MIFKLGHYPNIDSCRWNKSDSGIACDVKFTNGTTYRFWGVPVAVIDAWEAEKTRPGGSAGKFFNANIKGKFTSVKLDCQDCKRNLADSADLVIVSNPNDVVRAYCRDCHPE